MGKQIKGALYYLYHNSLMSLKVFWSIILLIFIFTSVVNLIFADDSIYFQGGTAAYFFAMAMGIWLAYSLLPYILKLGITRKAVYVSILLYGLLLVLFNTVAINLLYLLSNLFGVNNTPFVQFQIDSPEASISFSHITDILASDSVFTRGMVDIAFGFLLFACGFLVSLIFYRFKLLGGFGFIAVLIIAFLYGIKQGWVFTFISNVYESFSMMTIYQIFGIGLIIYLCSFIVLRRATV